MSQSDKTPDAVVSVEEIQRGWQDLTLRVGQLEAQRLALEQENRALRKLIERVVDHRQKSHAELIMLLTALVSKLPMNDIGTIVSRLVEHNTSVNHVLGALGKGLADVELPEPAVLKTLEQTKKDLLAALHPVVEELVRLDTPFEKEMLLALMTQPDLFFAPRMVRANRCFVKGQVPRERILREYGETALPFFSDATTDPKLNPRPKPEEIALAFKPDFEALFQQNPALLPEKRQELFALYQRVQQSKASSEHARTQKIALCKLSFIIELLFFYEHQNTQAPDVVFAQRLPAQIEQLVFSSGLETLDEKLIAQAESLMALIVSPEYRQMVVNNIGKAGGAAKTLKCVLGLRVEKAADPDELIAELIKHLIPAAPQPAPSPASMTAVLRLIKPEMQSRAVKAIFSYERIRKDDAANLARAIGAELGMKVEELAKHQESMPVEVERKIAWANISELLSRRGDPSAVAATIRERLNAKYNGDELRQSWITLTEADPMMLIRVLCQIPYRSDGKTDPIARTVMETYISRLTHEKYASTYHKVMNSLKNIHRAKADSPTLLTFVALVRWVNAEAADKMCGEIGMPIPAH